MRIYLERENFLHYLKHVLQLDSRKQKKKKKKKNELKKKKKSRKKPFAAKFSYSFSVD